VFFTLDHYPLSSASVASRGCGARLGGRSPRQSSTLCGDGGGVRRAGRLPPAGLAGAHRALTGSVFPHERV